MNIASSLHFCVVFGVSNQTHILGYLKSNGIYLIKSWYGYHASNIVSTATRPAGQVTWKSTCPAAKPTCPAFLYDNVFSQLTNKGKMGCCLHLVLSGYLMLFWY